MKDYGHLLRDDPEWAERAEAFAAKVRDVTELLAELEPRAARHPVAPATRRLPRRLPPGPRPGRARAAARRCCARSPASSCVEPAELGDLLRLGRHLQPLKPEPAAELGRRKARNLLATGAEAVAAANPGCALQIAAHAERGRAAARPTTRWSCCAASIDGGADHGTTLDVRARPGAGRYAEILTDDALALRRRRCTATLRPRARASCSARAARAPGASSTRAARSTSCPRPRERPRGRLAGRARARRPAGPPRRDHRPDRPQDGHQRAELGRRGFMADFEDSQLADLGQHGRRARSTCVDAIEGTIEFTASRRASEYRAGRRGGDAARAPARLAPARAARARRRRAGVGRARGLRAVPLPQRAAAARPRQRARTSTCPRWRATSRRGCGTTSSCSPRTRSASPRGTIRATVLIETIPAAFEMDEILYELREHSGGLNAGRWDYIFSIDQDASASAPEFVLPDRAEVTMTVPFMRAYTRAAGQDLPPARRARDGRHGGVHPEPQGPGGQRARRSTRCAPTRSARRATASTAPGSRTPTRCRGDGASSTRCWASGPTRSTGSATTSTSRAERAARRRRRRRATITEDGPARQRQRRHPVHLVVAARQRRGRRSTA